MYIDGFAGKENCTGKIPKIITLRGLFIVQRSDDFPATLGLETHAIDEPLGSDILPDRSEAIKTVAKSVKACFC